MIISGYDFLKSQVLSCWRKVYRERLRRRYLLRQSVPDTGVQSQRGRLSLVRVNAPAAGSMPLGPPQRMHGRRSAWRRSWPRGRREWRIGVSVCCRLMWLVGKGEELCDTADDQLFNKTVYNSYHVLHTLLPPQSIASQHYNQSINQSINNRGLRSHMLTRPEHDTHLSDCNFLTRVSYKRCYWLFFIQFFYRFTN